MPVRGGVANRSRHAAVAWLVALLSVPAVTIAEPPVGRPAVERFAPTLEVYPANYAVAQDPVGWIYVGNADGLMSFDGSRWRLHEVPGEGFVRSLAHDGVDRLYVGGYDTFGYFETPIDADSGFIDLTVRFGLDDPDFADIWHVEVAPEGVFFVALDEVFRFDPEQGETGRWQHDGRFGALGRVHGTLYLQYRGEGLRAWRDGDFVDIGIDPIEAQLYDLLPLPDGAMLATARDGRWRVVRDRRVSDFPVPDALPPSSQVASVATIGDPGDLIVLGTVDGRALFFDPISGEVESLKLANEWIVDVEPSPQGGLIAQSDLETMYVRWPAEWTAWNHDHGLLGSVNEVLRWGGDWLAVTNSGVFAAAVDAAVEFRLLPWTDFEAWDFHALEDGTGLLADSYALRHVDRDGVLQSLPAIQYPRGIVASPYDEETFFVGTEQGLHVVRRGAGGFAALPDPTDGAFGGVYSMVETAPRRLVIGTLEHGVHRLELDEQYAVRSVTRIDDGIEYPGPASVDVVRLGGVLHALTETSAWRWNGSAFEPADIDGLDDIWSAERMLTLVESPDGELWAWDHDAVWRREAAGEWREMEVGPLLRGAINGVHFDDRGRALIGASASVAIRETNEPARSGRVFDPMISEIRLTDAEGRARRLEPAQRHELPAGAMSIRFDYSMPGLGGRRDIRYRARLEGYEPRFSDWETTTRYTYINLEPGSYRFLAEARGPGGSVRAAVPFEFEIVPPWYRAAWVQNLRWPVMATVLALLIWALMRARVWRLETERARLAEQVTARTRELERANHELKRMAEVDELTGIANRRSFDRYLRSCLQQRGDRALAVALIDLDRFKPYNDVHGHLAGDRILRSVASCLVEAFEFDGARVARFGGDEFAAVLPGIDAERARRSAEAARRRCADRCEQVEMSIGIAAVAGPAEVKAVDMVEAADHELYRIKRGGRNAVRARQIGPGPAQQSET